MLLSIFAPIFRLGDLLDYEIFFFISFLTSGSRFNREIRSLINEVLTQEGFEGDAFDEDNWTEVLQMRRRNILLETSGAPHPERSTVKDCYVQVDEAFFGEIEAICHVDTEEGDGHYVIVVRKYERIDIEYSWGPVRVQFPINQIPYIEPNRAYPEFKAFLLRRNTFVQKAHTSTSTFKDGLLSVKLFSLLPNEFLCK